MEDDKHKSTPPDKTIAPNSGDGAELPLDDVETWPPQFGSIADDPSQVEAGLDALPGIDLGTGIQNSDGDVNSYLRLLNNFLEKYSGFLELLEDDFDQGRYKQAMEAIRLVAKQAENLGAQNLADVALKLIEAIYTDVYSIPQAQGEFATRMNEFFESIRLLQQSK